MKSEPIRRKIYDKLARYYDMTHKMHPYKVQADFANMVFQKYGNGGNHALDVGCGTGEHAKYMIENGYDVTGIDLSDEMLAIAKRKFRNRDKKPSFIQMDVTELDFDQEFDGAYCFGSTFVYMTTYETLLEALKGIWCSLKDGGVFTFDILNGWQMLDPVPHMHISQEDNIKIIRFEKRSIDKMRRMKHIDSLWVIEENGRISLELDSDEYRIFFHDELQFLLKSKGFEILAICVDNLSLEFTPDSRFITFVARKVMRT